jgi:hypothetical protein
MAPSLNKEKPPLAKRGLFLLCLCTKVNSCLSRVQGAQAQTALASLVVQQHDQDDQGDRDSEQPKKDGHCVSPFFEVRLVRPRQGLTHVDSAPRSVSHAAAFPCCSGRREGADEEGQRQPNCRLRCGFARLVEI